MDGQDEAKDTLERFGLSDVDVDAVERLSRQVTGEWYSQEPFVRQRRADEGSVAPYTLRNRPIIREQLNSARRRHSDWPSEWYVRVPGSRVTWNPQDLETWGIKGKALMMAFPDAERAEEFAQKVWRDVWKGRVREDAVIEVTRQRMFVIDARRSEDVQALSGWEPFQRNGLVMGDAIFVMRNAGIEVPAVAKTYVPDEREPERRQWLGELSLTRSGADRSGSVFFNPAAFEPTGYPTFVSDARSLWKQAGDVGKRDPQAREACEGLRTSLESAVTTLNGDIKAAMEHAAPEGARPVSTAPVMAEHAEFERRFAAGRARRDSEVATPVDRTPWDFEKALNKAREHALALKPTPETASDVNSIRLGVDRLCERALAFRTREVGIYAKGHVGEVAVQSLLEGQAGLATDNRPLAADDETVVAATKLPSGKFIVWRARSTSLEDTLHPTYVGRRLFGSLDGARDSVDGLPVTLTQSDEAVRMWKASVKDPKVVAAAMREAPAVEVEAGALNVETEGPKETRWAYRIAPLGPGRSVVFAEDTWGLHGDPVPAVEDPTTQRLVPLTGSRKGTPVVVAGGTFADRVVEAQARWPGEGLVASDLPVPLAKSLLTRHGVEPAPIGPKDALWHVSPAGVTRPAVAVAWTYQIAVADGQAALRALPLARADRSLIRFTGPTAHDAIMAGYEALNGRGFAADATRRVPREVIDVAHREAIRMELKDQKLAELRPGDPFEVFSRLGKMERGRALKAVPEDARNVVEAAALGLQPREIAPARGLGVEDVSRQYLMAERALADHFSQRPELAEHQVTGPSGPKLKIG